MARAGRLHADMPEDSSESAACILTDETTTEIPSTSRSAIGPSAMRAPANMGPVAVKRPSPSARTAASAASGGSPFQPGSAPRDTRRRAPTPASCAAAAVSGSQKTPRTAFGALASINARSSPSVLESPPPPGLSWVSAIIAGAAADAHRPRRRLGGSENRAGEISLGAGDRRGEAVRRLFRLPPRVGVGKNRRSDLMDVGGGKPHAESTMSTPRGGGVASRA